LVKYSSTKSRDGRQTPSHDSNFQIATRSTVNCYSWFRPSDYYSTDFDLLLVIQNLRLSSDRL